MKPFIALYKAFTGGEWFEASLEGVRANTDGAVVVFSERPWVSSLPIECDCREPLTHFMARHPDYPVHTRSIDSRDQADQYTLGIEAIRAHFGDVHVLVVDTDEVWEAAGVKRVRDALEANPQVRYVRAGLYSYVRSPLYQVWPLEPACTTVGLQTSAEQPTASRFRWDAMPGQVMTLGDVRFHHYGWVRRDEQALRCKLLNTSGQEDSPLDPAWMDHVWPELPRGADLHPSVGAEHVWKQVRVLPHSMLPPVVARYGYTESVVAEADRWRDRVHEFGPNESVWPQPQDADLYPDQPWLAQGSPPLVSRLQTTVAEAMWLHALAAGAHSVLEIGSGHGGSLACMALAASGDAHLTAIDPFKPYDEETHNGTFYGADEGDEASFWRTARDYGYDGRVTHIAKRSMDAVNAIPDASQDVILVDGNHSGDVVAAELRAYWPKLRPTGILLGHDYTTRFPGVVREFDKWEAETGNRVVCPAGTSLVYAQKGGR